MLPEIISLVARVSAKVTDERFLARVRPLVNYQSCLLAEPLVAVAALEAFVVRHVGVLVSQSHCRKTFVAGVTGEYFLLRRGVEKELVVLAIF